MDKRNCSQCESFYKLLLARMNKRNSLIKNYVKPLFDFLISLQNNNSSSLDVLLTKSDFEFIVRKVYFIDSSCTLPIDKVLSDLDMQNPEKEFKPCSGQLDFLRELDAASNKS